MNDPKLRPVSLAAYYPKELQADMAAFNEDLAAVNTAREELRAAAEALRSAAISATIEHPERLTADAENLRAKSAALDVAEFRLIGRKAAFQEPVIQARGVEKLRLADLGKRRVAELKKKLAAVAPGTRYENGILNEDPKLVEIKALQGAVSDFVRIVTEEDEAHAGKLQARLAEIVPNFTARTAPAHSVFKRA